MFFGSRLLCAQVASELPSLFLHLSDLLLFLLLLFVPFPLVFLLDPLFLLVPIQMLFIIELFQIVFVFSLVVKVVDLDELMQSQFLGHCMWFWALTGLMQMVYFTIFLLFPAYVFSIELSLFKLVGFGEDKGLL